MSDNFKNFNSKFNVDELLIVQTEYWRWSLRPIQCTLGAGILSLRRPAETMSELSADEGADLIKGNTAQLTPHCHKKSDIL